MRRQTETPSVSVTTTVTTDVGADWLHCIAEEVAALRPEFSRGELKRDVALLQNAVRSLSEGERHVVFSVTAGKACVEQSKVEQWFWELPENGLNT